MEIEKSNSSPCCQGAPSLKKGITEHERQYCQALLLALLEHSEYKVVIEWLNELYTLFQDMNFPVDILSIMLYSGLLIEFVLQYTDFKCYC